MHKQCWFLFTGRDVDLNSVQARFLLNETRTEVEISIIDDTILESVELFQLTLLIPNTMRRIGVVRGGLFSVPVEIISDDSKVQYR